MYVGERPSNYFYENECFTVESHVFIQVACIIENDELVNRQKLDLMIACMATFVALFIFSFIDYIWQIQKNDYIEWDVKTV